MTEAVIVSAVRTPIGALGGALAAVRPAGLAALVVGEAWRRGAGGGASRAPYAVPKAEQPFAFGNLTAWDTALGWRFPSPRMQELYGTESMGETAENIYEMTRTISRAEQDAFSVESHRRAIDAIDSRRFAAGGVPLPVPHR